MRGLFPEQRGIIEYPLNANGKVSGASSTIVSTQRGTLLLPPNSHWTLEEDAKSIDKAVEATSQFLATALAGKNDVDPAVREGLAWLRAHPIEPANRAPLEVLRTTSRFLSQAVRGNNKVHPDVHEALSWLSHQVEDRERRTYPRFLGEREAKIEFPLNANGEVAGRLLPNGQLAPLDEGVNTPNQR